MAMVVLVSRRARPPLQPLWTGLEGCLTEQWRWLTGRRRWLTAAPLADWAAPLNAAGRDINGHCKSALFLQRKLQAVL